MQKKLLSILTFCVFGYASSVWCMNKEYNPESEDLVSIIQEDGSLDRINIVVHTDKPLRSDKEGKTFMPSMGAGDIFQCLPNLKHLKNKGAGTVVYDVPNYLKSIIQEDTEFGVGQNQQEDEKYVQLSTLYNINDGYTPEYNCDKPLISPSLKEVTKWKELVTKYSNGKMPVVVFWGCAKNHRPDRALKEEELFQLVKNVKNLQFFDTEFRSPHDYEKLPNVKEVIKPSSICTNFDKKSFCDSAALLKAVYELGGKAVSTETGTLHLSGRVAEGAHDDVVYGLGPVDPNERYSNCWAKKMHKSELYPKSLILYWQKKKNDWNSVITKVREDLEEQGETYKVPGKSESTSGGGYFGLIRQSFCSLM